MDMFKISWGIKYAINIYSNESHYLQHVQNMINTLALQDIWDYWNVAAYGTRIPATLQLGDLLWGNGHYSSLYGLPSCLYRCLYTVTDNLQEYAGKMLKEEWWGS